jgi:hypothetical protein
MRFREWSDDRPENSGGGQDDGNGSGNLDELRRRGEMLLARASEAIDKAKSGESEKFLKAVVQHGGQ